MKISLNWLSDYVEINLAAEQVARLLSDRGFPTESVRQAEDDTVIDLEVTSNRGDCLSHIGIARELAAATGKQLKLPDIKLPESEEDVSKYISVDISSPDLCGRYTARVIKDTKVGPSPEWMRKRLDAVGIRSVNNIVDASNYAMMESGQPPHAFDYDKIRGSQIIVRKGLTGEHLVSIDGTKCRPDENMLVIADAECPVAIAGVMGGLNTEISDSTTSVLLEEAYFNPVNIRSTGRKLALKSEAAFRFERNVNIEAIDWASRRCAELIVKVAGGTVVKGAVDIYPAKWQRQTVAMRFSRLVGLLGIEIPKDTVVQILAALGFEPQMKQDDLTVCTIPAWRQDIYREIDLIEEIARSYGYDKIPVEKKINIEVAPVDRREKISLTVRNFLNGCGFYETINVSFIDSQVAEIFAEDDSGACLAVRDESGRSANLLRQSLIGSLVNVIKTNRRVGNSPCRIFELADTFKPHPSGNSEQLPVERTMLAMATDGQFSEIKGVVEGLIALLNKNTVVDFKPVQLPWAQAAAQITVNGDIIGRVAALSEAVKAKFDIEQTEICAAEMDFETLMRLKTELLKAQPVPKFPSIERDLSLIVDENVMWADIAASIRSKAPAELERIDFAGLYRGKPIPDGKKSVTVSLRFRDCDGTLTHQAVDAFQEVILDELTASLAAQLRTA